MVEPVAGVPDTEKRMRFLPFEKDGNATVCVANDICDEFTKNEFRGSKVAIRTSVSAKMGHELLPAAARMLGVLALERPPVAY